MSSVRGLMQCDADFRAGLEAAAQVLTNVCAREECLRKCREAIENEKQLVVLDADHFDTILSDIQWKETLLKNLPLDPTEEQYRAIIVLVKCQPFLSQIQTPLP